jgi:phosphatidylserine/phosphatidylglycerophosphate/cardiolipin synthase-like enzyme
VILGEEGRPVAVWTGSTNVTAGGIFGHSNVGHVVRDPEVAKRFLAYWRRLEDDDEAADLRRWNEQHSPVPGGAPPVGTTAIFSPRASLEALDWYAELMDRARQGVFFTAAFGINKKLDAVLLEPKGYLRYCLLEKPDAEMELMERDPDNRFAVGSLIAEDSALERWLDEQLTGLNTHVRYVHTKYMLIDPLGDDPIVVTGSANFSDASTRNNDENMLVIRGDTRVADIYLGEFMRLFNHFRFRQVVAAAGGDAAERPHLDADDRWLRAHYRPESFRAKERQVFSGTND